MRTDRLQTEKPPHSHKPYMKLLRWVIVVCAIIAGFAALYLLVTRGDQINADLNEIINSFSQDDSKKREQEVSSNHKKALRKAQYYVDNQHLSEEGLRDKLTGSPDYFSKDAAQYAIEHVKADYRANALFKAREYAKQYKMDAEAIDRELTGIVNKFTPAEADYAIQKLEGPPPNP